MAHSHATDYATGEPCPVQVGEVTTNCKVWVIAYASLESGHAAPIERHLWIAKTELDAFSFADVVAAMDYALSEHALDYANPVASRPEDMLARGRVRTAKITPLHIVGWAGAVGFTEFPDESEIEEGVWVECVTA